MKYTAFVVVLVLLVFAVFAPYCAFAQGTSQEENSPSTAGQPLPETDSQPPENSTQAENALSPQQTPAMQQAFTVHKETAPIHDSLAAANNVTLDFKEADIHNVLKILAQKAGLNIVATPDVMGTVTIKLTDVPWERALDIILKSNGFGFQRQGNVILVTKIENMAKIQSDEPLRTEIVNLKFLDAQDAQRILIPMLSPRGKISILYARGQKGWQFGSFKIGGETVTSGELQKESSDKARQEIIAVEKTTDGKFSAAKIDYEPSIKSKTLLITDTDSTLDRIINQILPKVDRKPKQVLIEARIMEVNADKLRDIGFDYATGSTGAENTALQAVNLSAKGGSVTRAALALLQRRMLFLPRLAQRQAARRYKRPIPV